MKGGFQLPTYILDKFVLVFASLGVAIYGQGTEAPVVIGLLITISIYAFGFYFDKEELTLGLFLFYLILCLFNGTFCYFIPLICYDMFVSRYRQALALFLIPFLLHISEIDVITALLIILVTVLTLLMSVRNEKLKRTQLQFNRFRDDNQEYKIKLEAMNEELMEKQDYEVHMATLHERTRIAREIHDNVGHMLSRSILQVGALMAVTKDEYQKSSLADLKSTLDKAMTSIRESVHDLHNESLDLYQEIQELIQAIPQYKIDFEYSITKDLNRKFKYSILAIIKEALANITKHSNATMITIALVEHPALYQVLIRDNGRDIAPIADTGIGMHNMQDRVDNMNGTLNISTKDGFRIFISIPKEKEKM